MIWLIIISPSTKSWLNFLLKSRKNKLCDINESSQIIKTCWCLWFKIAQELTGIFTLWKSCIFFYAKLFPWKNTRLRLVPLSCQVWEARLHCAVVSSPVHLFHLSHNIVEKIKLMRNSLSNIKCIMWFRMWWNLKDLRVD